MTKIHTHYDSLGVSRDAQPEVIKAAYKALASKYHPDKNPNNSDAEQMMKSINEAYEVLSDPSRRAQYDQWIDAQETQYSQNTKRTYNYQHSNDHERTNPYQRHDFTYYSAQTKHALHSFWSMHGRMRRRTYILLFIPTAVLAIFIRNLTHDAGVHLGMDAAITGEIPVLSMMALLILELIPYLFITFISIKRLHDCNYSGWWTALPFVQLIILFAPATKGVNQFGADPRIPNKNFQHKNARYDYSFIYLSLLLIAINLAMLAIAVSEIRQTISLANQGGENTHQQSNNSVESTPSIKSNSPQAVHQLGEIITTAQDIYLYECASANCSILGIIPQGEELIITTDTNDAHYNNGWFHVDYHGNFCATNSNLSTCNTPQYTSLKGWIYQNAGTGTQPTPDASNTVVTTDYSNIMAVYHKPELAPTTQECYDSELCNAFVAIAQQWHNIPIDYRYQGFDIRQQAAIGDAHGLHKGFTLQNQRSIELAEAGNIFLYQNANMSGQEVHLFAQGLAMLLYIEDQNGWAQLH